MANTNNSLKAAIQAYLDKRAKEDALFAETYKKENKSIDECCNYVMQQARKMASKQQAQGLAVDDATVYGWVVHYYDEDDIKVQKMKENVEVSVPAPAPAAMVEEKKPKKPVKKTAGKDPWEERQLSLF